MKITKIIPFKIRKFLLDKYYSIKWRKNIKNFKQNKKIDYYNLDKLINSWGNKGFSANKFYLNSCIKYSINANNSILECGSGLSTILIGILIKGKKITLYSLEHNKFWFKKISKELKRLNLDNVKIIYAPLKDYGTFEWYNIEPKFFKEKYFDVIICDGPPADTKGGRFGLIPVLKEKMNNKTKILVDDTIRQGEREMIEKWKTIIDFKEEKIEEKIPHSILHIS